MAITGGILYVLVSNPALFIMFRLKSYPNLANLLSAGKHQLLEEYSRQYLQRTGISNGRHFKEVAMALARSEYYRGLYEQSSGRLQELVSRFPNDADLYYLLADNQRLIGNQAAAWQYLEEVAQRSKRLKTWLYMAQLVTSMDDAERFMQSLELARQAGLIPNFHPHLEQYIATAHQYAGNYSAAFTAWQNLLDNTPLVLKKIPFGKAKSRIKWSTDAALRALRDLKMALENGDIEVFLISGTLLGAMREGKLLAHDNDIDVGIWASENVARVRQLISQCGFFHLMPQRKGDSLRIKHINGTAIDVFRHHCEGDQVWHGGLKVRWYNHSFDTMSLVKLGSTYSVPKDYERYLEENYDDWRTPCPHFDSTLDPPNSRIMLEPELAIHCYKKKYAYLYKGPQYKVLRYNRILKSIVG